MNNDSRDSREEEDDPQPYISSLEPQSQLNATDCLLSQFDEQYKKNSELFNSPDSCKMPPQIIDKTDPTFFSFKAHPAQNPPATAPIESVEVSKKSTLMEDLQKEFNSLNSKINGLESKIKENTELVKRPRSSSTTKKFENKLASSITQKNAKQNRVSSSIEMQKGTFKSNIRDKKQETNRNTNRALSTTKKVERKTFIPAKPVKKAIPATTTKPQPVKENKENHSSNNKADAKEIAALRKEMAAMAKKAKTWEDKYNKLLKEHTEMKAEYDSSETLRKKQNQLIKNLRNQLNMSAN